MANINTLTTLAYVKASMAADRMKAKMKEELESFKSDERGVEGFVVALILIGIAAVLAIAFKDSIKEIMDTLIEKINSIFEEE